MDNNLYAYIAGVLDSDGYIVVQRTKKKNYVNYMPKVGLDQTNEEIPYLLESTFGGKVYVMNPRADTVNPNPRVRYSWSTTQGTIIAGILRGVLPFLRVKVRQAELALALHDLKVQCKSIIRPGGWNQRGWWVDPSQGEEWRRIMADMKEQQRQMWAEMVKLNDKSGARGRRILAENGF